ncbi:MAG: DUF4258 domain-containing protein [Armatimonadetes bacterium]|nr:DUF4258 domain-containing protein [Armatimonadota bacterium]
MRFRFSRHAREQMAERRIPVDLVGDVLTRPEQTVPECGGRKVYQSRVRLGNRPTLLRVIVDERADPAVVVTVYQTSRITKYWREP